MFEVAGGDGGEISRRLLVGAICNLVAGQLLPVIDPRAADPAVAVEHECRVQRVHAPRTLRHVPLDVEGPRALIQPASWPDGRCRIAGVCGPSSKPGGGKSGLHGDTVAANGRRGRPQGKCHRKQTAFGSPEVRVKGCGKSAPRGRRRSWQGKPHREQDQIGVAGRARKRGARSVIRPATRVGCLRRLAMGAPDEWPSRRDLANTRQAGVGLSSRQNPAYRPAGNFITGVSGWTRMQRRAIVRRRSVSGQVPIVVLIHGALSLDFTAKFQSAR